VALNLEEIRVLLLQALRRQTWNQVAELEMAVGSLKAKVGNVSQQQRGYIVDGRGYLERGESSLIHELIWSFIVQGVLVPGADDSNQALIGAIERTGDRS
jgi:hypothetical protein